MLLGGVVSPVPLKPDHFIIANMVRQRWPDVGIGERPVN